MLQVRDLACARGGVPVLCGVSFDVAVGQALLLRGPNGSGKTTLLRTLAGLQPPLAGTVSPGPDDMAYGGHADAVKATLSVEENLSFWAGVYGSNGIDDALAAFDLTKLRQRTAGGLSAGQTRRLGLARLLVSVRNIWLLDEPTVSLDQASVALFAAALSAHLDNGGAAVIATHIDPGFSAETLDLGPYRARPDAFAMAGDMEGAGL